MTLQTTNSLDIIAGIWMALSPFVLGFAGNPTLLWNNVLLGVAVAGMAIAKMTRTVRARSLRWMSWITFLIGLWFVISPLAYGVSDVPEAVWNNTLGGIIIAALALWNAIAMQRARE